jgi:predicted dinucleotide-binding enzyme
MMRIGLIGGSGSAGSALATRLASVGYRSVVGSRSNDRAVQRRDAIVRKHPELGDVLSAGDNALAAGCDLVIIATPWDSAAMVARSPRSTTSRRCRSGGSGSRSSPTCSSAGTTPTPL